MIELLVPAKNKETAICAINYGADAVYMGACAFGARKNAGNSLSDIKEVVDYGHQFRVKTYITLNTILDDTEIKEAQKLIYDLYDIGIDAIIVQDMGLLELKLPPVPIFASTQCDIRTLEKVKFLEQKGIKRVILARELSIPEIEEICKNTNLEVETFIQGALCVSYSGQCYLSYTIGGRSANRGECAQPCRKKYSLIKNDGSYIAKNKYLLSLKDFNAEKHLKKLIDIGVSSFKIEGRLKDINYVKNTTAYYRLLLDKIAKKTSLGVCKFDFEPNLNKTFNRGFTDYFLEKRKSIWNFETPKSMGEKIGTVIKVNKDNFELKGTSPNPQDGLCFISDSGLVGCLVNKVSEAKIYPFKMPDIKKGVNVFRNLDFEFFKKLENSKTKRVLMCRVEFLKDRVNLKDEEGNIVSISLDVAQKAQNQERMKEIIKEQFRKTGESNIEIESIEIEKCELPFLKISQINKMRRDLTKKLFELRLTKYECKKQKAFKDASFAVKNLDYRANIHNKYAKAFWERAGCRVLEMSLESQKIINNKEIMRTKHCLKYAFNMCGAQEKLFLTDEKGQKYPLEFDCKNCEMVIKSPI